MEAVQKAWILEQFVLEDDERVWLVLRPTLSWYYYALAVVWYLVGVSAIALIALFILAFPTVLPFGLAAYADRRTIFGAAALLIVRLTSSRVSKHLRAAHMVYVFTNIRMGFVYWRDGPPDSFATVRYDSISGLRASFDAARFGSVTINEVVCLKTAAEMTKLAAAAGSPPRTEADAEYGMYGVVKHTIANIPEADDMARVLRRLVHEQKEPRNKLE